MSAESFDVAEAQLIAAARAARWSDRALRAQVMPRHPWAWIARVASGWAHDGTLRSLEAEAETPEGATEALLGMLASPLDARWPFLMRPYTGMTPRALRVAVYRRAVLGGDVEPHLDAVGGEHRARMAAALRSAGVGVSL